MRYLDSANRSYDQTLHAWLDQALVDATYFGCQAGYFTADGLYPFESQLKSILDAGGEVHVVVGANEDSLTSADLEYVLELQAPYGARGSLVVVSASDVLMHSKTYLVEKGNGTREALVGSPNLTPYGLVRNIEAGIALSSSEDTPDALVAIRSGIDAWRSGARSNGYVVTPSNLRELVIGGVLDRPRPIRPRTRMSKKVGHIFGPLGALAKLPRRPRAVRSGGKRSSISPAAPSRVRGAANDLPVGFVGIVKQLSKQDVKGFRGDGGTPYIALAKTLLQYFPTQAEGENNEPTFHAPLVARLDGALADPVPSDLQSSNLKGVGMGTSSTSNPDLRFNLPKGVVTGIASVAHRRGLSLPEEDDYVLIEFPTEFAEMRLTFVTGQAGRATVADLVTVKRGRWGWLPSGIAPTW